MAEIDRLLDHHTAGKIAAIPNVQGFQSGCGQAFEVRHIWYLCKAYGLKQRETRLREAGLLTLEEVAKHLGICKKTVKRRRLDGTIGLRAERLDDNGRYMYKDPGCASARQQPWLPASREEVQYET